MFSLISISALACPDTYELRDLGPYYTEQLIALTRN